MPDKRSIRYAVLAAITMHNSVHTLLIRHTRSRPMAHMYHPTEAVLYTECVKLVACSLIVLGEHRTLNTLYAAIVTNWRSTVRVSMLALLYTIQSNLFYIGATYLQAAPFIVTSQLKILTTALCSVVMLGTRLRPVQWVSLLILTLGVCLVQAPSDIFSANGAVSYGGNLYGFTTVLLACLCSGVACVWFEKMLKQDSAPTVWVSNVQLALCAIPISFVGAVATEHQHLQSYGWQYGFDATVWLMVVWYALGGLIVACVMKYSDNIVKNFAVSIAVIISTVASVFVFDFRPGNLFVIGTGCVIGALFLYNFQSAHSTVDSTKGVFTKDQKEKNFLLNEINHV